MRARHLRPRCRPEGRPSSAPTESRDEGARLALVFSVCVPVDLNQLFFLLLDISEICEEHNCEEDHVVLGDQQEADAEEEQPEVEGMARIAVGSQLEQSALGKGLAVHVPLDEKTHQVTSAQERNKTTAPADWNSDPKGSSN